MASVRHNRKRKLRRRRSGWLFKLLCVAALAAAVTLGATVFFQVETVVVSGNSRYTAQEVEEASGVQIGDNLFQINKNQVSRQILQQLPYIGEVSPQRRLPSTLILQVKETAAVARVEVYDEPLENETDSGENEGSETEPQESAVGAEQPWLISVSGKLLETATESSGGISVTGLELLAPQAGTMAAVPREQQYRLDALKELLAALEEMGQLEWVTSIDLSHSTWIEMRYRQNFDARLPLGEDLRYSMEVLSATVEDTLERRGPQAAGTMDLTQGQDEFAAIFTPAES